MIGRLCTRVGAMAGGAAALIVAFAKTQPCCVPAPPPDMWDYLLAGWIAATIVALLAMLFRYLVLRQPLVIQVLLGLWIALFVGAFGGIIGGLAANWIIALVFGLLIGAATGWLLCRLCARFQFLTWGVRHG